MNQFSDRDHLGSNSKPFDDLTEESTVFFPSPGVVRRQQLEPLFEDGECFVPLQHETESTSGRTTDLITFDKQANNCKSTTPSATATTPQSIVIVLLVAFVAILLTGNSLFVERLLLPVFTLVSAWACLELVVLRQWRGTISSTTIVPLITAYHLSGCAALAECCGYVFVNMFSTPLHPLRTLIVLTTLGSLLLFFSTSTTLSPPKAGVVIVFIAFCRNAASLTFLPLSVAPFLVYGLGVVVGVLLDTFLFREDNSGSSATLPLVGSTVLLSSERQRRRSIMSSSSTSSDRALPTSYSPLQLQHNQTSAKGRRTSLPSLSMHRHRHSLGSMPSYESAVMAEAHGIITDMLADGTLLPPHIASGLRAVAVLLEQPNVSTPSSASARMRNGPFVSLSEVCSDTEESPFTGERPQLLPKRFRRSLPLSLLRRMSTSTWTTTTSATGLPTLEPEPSRKRSTSFRHTPVSSPCGSRSQSPSPACSPNSKDANYIITTPKQRSFSTILPSRTSPNTVKKHQRDSNNVPDIMFSKCVKFDLGSSNSAPAADYEGGDGEEQQAAERHLSPAIRRINLTSDYESSESPSNSEYGESTTLLDDSSGSTCVMPEPLAPDEAANVEQATPSEKKYRVEDISFDLDTLEEHPLLNQLQEWDFPIFDLYNEMGDRILSQVAYKIFTNVGLFDTFKIPLQEFFNYFHCLEMGYRDKPYHNRIHAADVLHAVYFFSSQPIPGFTQITWPDLPKSPKIRPSLENTSAGQLLPNMKLAYANGSGQDDIYGIMGCNLPPLELMAMYTAAAMHDYDHPGRTNAFLVATNAPQAVLYNDRSVLENHHAAAAWRLLLSRPEFNWLCHLEKAEFKRFRYLVIEAILATDLKRHFEIIAEFNSKATDDDAPGLDWTNETDRMMACQMCIKLADINGPCKRKDLHLQWTYRITDEFFEQGDEEAGLGLPISPYMDRKNSQLARLQESFINHLVAPLCNAYGESGLLPGRWRFEEPDDDSPDEPTRRISLEMKSGEVTIEPSIPEEVPLPAERRALPQIQCLLTEHLKANHEMWVTKVKEEERLKEEFNAHSTSSISEDP